MKKTIGVIMAALGAFELAKILASGELMETFSRGGAEVYKGIGMLVGCALLLFFGFKLGKGEKKKDDQ